MALSTSIYILDDIDWYELFSQANLLMGNDSLNVLETTEEDTLGPTVTLRNATGQIIPARLTANFRRHFPLYPEDTCDPFAPGHLLAPECWGVLTFDINWDHRDMSGGAIEFAGRMLLGMHDWLSSKHVGMKWRDSELEIPNSGIEGLADFFERGDRKQEWFNREVLPKYEAMFLRSN